MYGNTLILHEHLRDRFCRCKFGNFTGNKSTNKILRTVQSSKYDILSYQSGMKQSWQKWDIICFLLWPLNNLKYEFCNSWFLTLMNHFKLSSSQIIDKKVENYLKWFTCFAFIFIQFTFLFWQMNISFFNLIYFYIIVILFLKKSWN